MTKCMEEKCKEIAYYFCACKITWKPEEIVYISYCKKHGDRYINKDWMKSITKDEFLVSVILES